MQAREEVSPWGVAKLARHFTPYKGTLIQLGNDLDGVLEEFGDEILYKQHSHQLLFLAASLLRFGFRSAFIEKPPRIFG